jgi:5-methylcytosine-specific restriction endonuclease McrA
MNKIKLADSIENFKRFYLQNREFYDEDERGWKENLSNRFAEVLARENILSDDFFSSLLELLSDNKVAQTVKWLGGGSFYQCQRFIDWLESEPNNSILRDLFNDLLYSRRSLKQRINQFKAEIDHLYRCLDNGGSIQLNLISQFMGLSQPGQYYIYKSTEFQKAERYFEFERRLTDTSAGGKYAHFLDFSKAILEAMRVAGLNKVDFIDVQTFIYRDDWYTERRHREVIDQYEEEAEKAQSLSIEDLLDRIRGAAPQPPRITRSTYYHRDPNITALVKKLALGECDLCGRQAPFVNHSGVPYLECHHIEHLADGGEDSLANCVALCPNCHTKMHVLNLESDRASLLTIVLSRSEKFH